MKNRLYKYILLLSVAVIIAGCNKDDIAYFDNQYASVCFPVGTTSGARFALAYTFLEDPTLSVKECDIPIRLIGSACPQLRTVAYKVVEGERTTAPKEAYEIIAAVIPANSSQGYIRVRVKNAPELDLETYTLGIRLMTSDELKEGPKEFLSCDFSWNNSIPVPTNSNYKRSYNMLIKGETNFISTSLNSYSSNAHRAIVAALGWNDWDDPTKHQLYNKDGYKYLPRYIYIYNNDQHKGYAARLKDYLNAYNEAHPEAPILHNGGKLDGQKVEARSY